MLNNMGLKWLWCVLALTVGLALAGCSEPPVFNRSGYANYIDIEAYLLTEQAAAEFLANPNIQPSPASFQSLRGKPVYLAVRLHNKGKEMYWGKLQCEYLPKRYYEWQVDSFNQGIYIIPLGKVISSKSEKIPPLRFRWKNLKAK